MLHVLVSEIICISNLDQHTGKVNATPASTISGKNVKEVVMFY